MSQIMRIHYIYEKGDPARPDVCVAELERDGRIVCTVRLYNENNEDIEEALKSTFKALGFCVVCVERSSNASADLWAFVTQ